MAPANNKKNKKPVQKRKNDRQLRREKDLEELKELEQRVNEFDPSGATLFDELPLSQQTVIGLKQSHFTTLTAIQKKSIPLALKGKDILGAAKTGSGKTLAFLIPLLECLYRNQWTQYDGLGALVISPTRELAIQIFDVLRKIGRAHTFSAGLVIGGKDVQVERDRISRLNILVGTPGRILQHMDQAAGFEIGNLKLLILDEADRILDMGFKKTVDAIVQHLPRERQTLLFSATQTKSVADLARLSLSSERAEYISAHEKAESSTPKNLQQYYVISPLPEKLNTLFGFLKTHLKSKIIVFVSSSKQVRFMFETFKTLHPGIPLMHLHGRQKQAARIDVTDRFSESKYACLICTDIVARGIDFPAVDWVVQLDAPEDADTYVHRVGRTARFEANGRALLMLAPSEEEGMLERLKAKKVPIEKITIKEAKKKSIRQDLQNLCFKSPEIKYLGQKAFASYCKSVYIQKDKGIFKFTELPAEEFAVSLGLPGAPRIKFINSQKAKMLKNAAQAKESESELSSEEEKDEEEENGGKKGQAVRTKYDRMFERQNQGVLSQHYMNMIKDEAGGEDGDGDDDGEFMSVKRFDHRLSDSESEGESDGEEEDKETTAEAINERNTRLKITPTGPLVGLDGAPVSKRQAKAALSKKAMLRYKTNPTKLVFDDEGKPHALYEFEDEQDFMKSGAPEEQIKQFVSKESERMQELDQVDKVQAKEKKDAKKRKMKEKFAAAAAAAEEESDESEGYESEEEEEDAAPAKRPRKWFEDESEDEESSRKKSKREIEVEQPQTLEDLEALSMRLLGHD
ncbi:ATP-dependent RNA helicase DBP4 [Myxozyma melibiosi]|uniref:ATP-dependent RNA helicase n=1 Tax=Myxozyma melibiosi TaxID=54550 RepID=A0ABR1F691_9ASCO